MAEQGFTLFCHSLREGETIPRRHTCDGENTSPHLEWMHAPRDTQSFLIIMDDPDAVNGTFTHWVLFDIPRNTGSLAEGETRIGTHGRNDFQHTKYGGPCPPPHHGNHRYFFKLHALDVESLGLASGATREEVEKAMRDHVLGAAMLMGQYQRLR